MSQNTTQTITIKVHSKKGVIATYKATNTPDNPTVIVAQSGMNYELIDDLTHFAPENIKIKRVGKDLQIAFEDLESTSFNPDVIIQDYYQYMEGDATANNSTLIGMHENGSLYAYVPEVDLASYSAPMLAQEVIAGQVLGGGAIATAGYANPSYWLAGLLGAGAVAAVASAGGGGGGSDNNDGTTDSDGTNGGTTGNGDNSGGTTSGGDNNGGTTSGGDNNGGTTSGGDNNGGTTGGGDITPPDTTKPEKPFVKPLQPTKDNTPEIGGNAEAGSTVTIEVKNSQGQVVAQGTTQAGTDGKWTYTPENSLPDGSHTVTVTATDQAGNKSEATTINTVVDTKKPDLVVNETLSKEAKPVITGTVDEQATVHVVIKDGENIVSEGDAKIGENGSWSYTPGKEIPEGHYDIEVIATDEAGNSATQENTLVRDSSIFTPDIVIKEDTNQDGSLNTAELGDKKTVTAVVTVPSDAQKGDTITITDTQGKVIKELVVGTDVLAGGKVDVKLPISQDGTSVQAHVEVHDAAGNHQTKEIYVDIDASSPSVQLQGDTNGDGIFNAKELGEKTELTAKVTIPRDATEGSVVVVKDQENNEIV